VKLNRLHAALGMNEAAHRLVVEVQVRHRGSGGLK
jgi:hypothetical protein